jgi:uncharacterized protein DUF5752
MGESFRFCTELRLVESTGIRVRNLERLLSGLREVPGASIFHHTHHRFLEHHFRTPIVYNDFAIWTGEALQEHELAERLTGLDLRTFTTIRELRTAIMEQVEKVPRSNHRWQRDSPPGEEFYFCRSRSFVMFTGLEASTAKDFFHKISAVSVNSLYFHFLEARLRLGHRSNDFSQWLASLGETKLAEAINALNPYELTLDELKEEIAQLDSRNGVQG